MKWLILLVIIIAALFYFLPDETKEVTGMAIHSLEPAKDNFIKEFKESDITDSAKDAAKYRVKEEVNDRIDGVCS